MDDLILENATLVLPDGERGRWRLHKALLDSSGALIMEEGSRIANALTCA